MKKVGNWKWIRDNDIELKIDSRNRLWIISSWTDKVLIVNLKNKKGIQKEFAKERERESEIHSVNWKLVREKYSESINPGAH